jgi:hypothetical protein
MRPDSARPSNFYLPKNHRNPDEFDLLGIFDIFGQNFYKNLIPFTIFFIAILYSDIPYDPAINNYDRHTYTSLFLKIAKNQFFEPYGIVTYCILMLLSLKFLLWEFFDTDFEKTVLSGGEDGYELDILLSWCLMFFGFFILVFGVVFGST